MSRKLDKKDYNDFHYFDLIKDGKRADACLKCGKCEKKCPQNIKVSKWFKTFI